MNDADEREWQAQELARRAEQLGLDPAANDGRVRSYRLLARALRQPLPVALPVDFAQQVAARAAAAPPISAPAGGRLESVLLTVLACILAVSAAVILAREGQSWLAATRAALMATDSANIRWPLALVGCIALSWMLSQGQQRISSRT